MYDNTNLVNQNTGGDIFEIFNFENLGRVQTIKKIDGSIWFCNNDVCRILEIQNPRTVVSRLNRDSVCQTDAIDTLGRRHLMTFIDQGNLFMLIMRSDKPQARRFYEWVCREVLVKLANTGNYSMVQQSNQPPMVQFANGLNAIITDMNERINVIENRVNHIDEVNKLAHSNAYITIEQFLQLNNIIPQFLSVDDLHGYLTDYCNEWDIPILFGERGKIYPYQTIANVLHKSGLY